MPNTCAPPLPLHYSLLTNLNSTTNHLCSLARSARRYRWYKVALVQGRFCRRTKVGTHSLKTFKFSSFESGTV